MVAEEDKRMISDTRPYNNNIGRRYAPLPEEPVPLQREVRGGFSGCQAPFNRNPIVCFHF
jgi:hypothetical protein